MKFILEHMFEYYTDDDYEKWDKFTNNLIQEYTLCTDVIEIDDHEIELWCYDADLEQLFNDYGIDVGEAFNIEKTFNYDEYYEPVGLDYGDYIETRELIQNGKTYLVPVYCAYNGNGADYAFAIFEATKKEEM